MPMTDARFSTNAEGGSMYCPKCGDWQDIDEIVAPEVIPGTQRITCLGCSTVWRVDVQFREEQGNA